MRDTNRDHALIPCREKTVVVATIIEDVICNKSE
jgi:hypothetical protein